MSLPTPQSRFNIVRPAHGFSELIGLVSTHFQAHQKLAECLGPYNAKQRSSGLPYLAPTKELLRSCIPQGRMNSLSYEALLSSTLRFCERTKGRQALPEPHPSTIHSVQLPEGAFELAGSKLTIIGLRPIELDLRFQLRQKPKFVIVRPKVSRVGTASAERWEALLFSDSIGYVAEWADTTLNPRYSGIL